MQTQQDKWVQNFRINLQRHIKRINNWHELKLKHQDYRIHLERQKVGSRTYVFNGSTIVMVHDANLY